MLRKGPFDPEQYRHRCLRRRKGQNLSEKVFAIESFAKDWLKRFEREAHLDHFGDELVGPGKHLANQNRLNTVVAYLVSLNPPFLALQRGERMASVMTTSSGLWFCKAAKPVPVPETPSEKGIGIRSTVEVVLILFQLGRGGGRGQARV